MRIAVCDDDKTMLNKLTGLVRKKLKPHISDFDMFSFSAGKELMNAYRSDGFDVLFLDIRMPDMSGFEIAKHIRNISDKTFIIFITTEEELIYDSLDFTPFNFIPKLSDEFMEKRLEHVIKKLVKRMRQNEKITLELPYGDKRNVPISDIIYIKSDKNYLEYTIDKAENLSIRGKISDEETRFADYGFVRIHNRILVNMKHIKRLDYPNNEVKTSGGIVKMSRAYRKLIEEAYSEYLKSQY